MPRDIDQTAIDANDLYAQLTAGLSITLSGAPITLPTDFDLPPDTGPAFEALDAITIEKLTTEAVDGTGVFDVLMRGMNAQLSEQHKSQRITGADYAKVYLGSLTAVLQTGSQFLLTKDQAYFANLQAQEIVKLTQAQRIRALADIQIARGEIQKLVYENDKLRLDALRAANEYAISKMELVDMFNKASLTEAQAALTNEQVDAARAQTKNTRLDGLDIEGLMSVEKNFKLAQQAQMEAQNELTEKQVQIAHGQLFDTRMTGGPFEGLIALEKVAKAKQNLILEAQYGAAYAQFSDVMPAGITGVTAGANVGGIVGIDRLIKLAQKLLTEEQVDTARAQTKDTLTTVGGVTPDVAGLALAEKTLKKVQAKYVNEQYVSQYAQTRDNLTGSTNLDGTLIAPADVTGMIGAQVKLYKQQVTSYERDAESKAIKLMYDTWTARKAIDEAVQPFPHIEAAALNQATAIYRGKLGLGDNSGPTIP